MSRPWDENSDPRNSQPTRKQLSASIRQLRADNARLQKRIAEMRRGYRRTVTAIRAALDKYVNDGRPDYGPHRPTPFPAARERSRAAGVLKPSVG
jgi:hypothetical protein